MTIITGGFGPQPLGFIPTLGYGRLIVKTKHLAEVFILKAHFEMIVELPLSC